MMVSWISAPPATPCNARPVIKTDILGAVAQTIELTKNHATDTKRMGFLPQMSDNLALEIVSTVQRLWCPVHKPDRCRGGIGK